MSDIKIGQVLSLRIEMPYYGEFEEKHPYIVLGVNEDNTVIEIGQLHSLQGKEFEAIDYKNKVIFKTMPDETVIDKDSFIQLYNKIQVENYEGLKKYRRQEDTLSKNKLEDVIEAYQDYQKKHHIADDRSVYLTKEDIERLNDL